MSLGMYPVVRAYIERGGIGKPVWASASYCRNMSPDSGKNRMLLYNPGIDADAGPHNINWRRWLGSAPRRTFSKERYFRWRKYKDYSGGLATDLLYHSLAPLVYVLGEQFPTRVTGSGGVYTYRDREVPDTFSMTIEYPGDYLVMLLSSMNSEAGLPHRICGQYGTIEFGGRGARVNAEPSRLKEFRERNNGLEKVTLETVSRPDMVSNWLDCIRTRGKTYMDAELGYKVMAAIRLGVDSYFDGRVGLFDPETRTPLTRAPKRQTFEGDGV